MSIFEKRFFTGLLLVGVVTTAYHMPALYSSCLLALILVIILTAEWPRIARNSPFLWLLTPLYPVLPFGVLIILNQSPVYRPLLILAIVSSALHDTGSYCIGSLWGRHAIAPSISPAKTWEGLYGGLIVNIVCCYAGALCMLSSFAPYMFIALVAIISGLAFLGDLFESWLKRRAKIKDSGCLLPGHGGFLDRFDSVMFVAVFLYCFKWSVMSILGF